MRHNRAIVPFGDPQGQVHMLGVIGVVEPNGRRARQQVARAKFCRQ